MFYHKKDLLNTIRIREIALVASDLLCQGLKSYLAKLGKDMFKNIRFDVRNNFD